jgi:hypothetical protein
LLAREMLYFFNVTFSEEPVYLRCTTLDCGQIEI